MRQCHCGRVKLVCSRNALDGAYIGAKFLPCIGCHRLRAGATSSERNPADHHTCDSSGEPRHKATERARLLRAFTNGAGSGDPPDAGAGIVIAGKEGSFGGVLSGAKTTSVITRATANEIAMPHRPRCEWRDRDFDTADASPRRGSKAAPEGGDAWGRGAEELMSEGY